MIIDVHTHAFPEKIADVALRVLKSKSHTIAFTDGTLNGLISSMKKSGVNYSFVQPVATAAHQVITINNTAIEINNHANLTGVFSFGGMHPDFDNYYSELERIKKSGLKGIKLHPVYQGVSIDDDRYIKILDRAAELDLMILIHAGWDIGFPESQNAMPEKIARALKLVKPQKIILAHMGGWLRWNEAAEILHDSGAYFDTAFSFGEITPDDDFYKYFKTMPKLPDREKFLTLLKNYGLDRVIFGTDSPWASQADGVNFIKSLGLAKNEEDMIFSENLKNLLDLKI